MFNPLNLYWRVLSKIEGTNTEISPGIVVRLVTLARIINIKVAVPTNSSSF